MRTSLYSLYFTCHQVQLWVSQTWLATTISFQKNTRNLLRSINFLREQLHSLERVIGMLYAASTELNQPVIMSPSSCLQIGADKAVHTETISTKRVVRKEGYRLPQKWKKVISQGRIRSHLKVQPFAKFRNCRTLIISTTTILMPTLRQITQKGLRLCQPIPHPSTKCCTRRWGQSHPSLRDRRGMRLQPE